MSDYVYELMKQHHSVRKFKNQPLGSETVEKLVEAGQSASTSSYLQTYSIIGVEDPSIKARLKEVSGQPYVLDNGYLFVFVLDYYRHHLVDEVAASNMETSYGSAEGLLVGISSGAALVASRKVLENSKFAGKTVVTVLPDSGDRYLSTDTFGTVEE